MARGFNYAPGASDEVELARAPDLQRAQIQALAQSRNVVVREVLAARRDLVLSQMVSLAHDRSADVRAALAGNPTASVPVLEHLSGDRQVPVLAALLSNPATPTEVVERLTSHRRSEVRIAAVRRIDDDAHGGAAPTADAPVPAATGMAPVLGLRPSQH